MALVLCTLWPPVSQQTGHHKHHSCHSCLFGQPVRRRKQLEISKVPNCNSQNFYQIPLCQGSSFIFLDCLKLLCLMYSYVESSLLRLHPCESWLNGVFAQFIPGERGACSRWSAIAHGSFEFSKSYPCVLQLP